MELKDEVRNYGQREKEKRDLESRVANLEGAIQRMLARAPLPVGRAPH